MVAINIRGTGGSGKSTLVRAVLKLYPNHANILVPKRKRPLATTHWFGNESGINPIDRPRGLLVPGHYETACGGCDTIKTVDEVYTLVRAAALGDGNNVLYEGIMVMDDVRRAIEFDRELKEKGDRLVVISLTTDIEDCLAGIRARRGAEKEAAKPLNEKNTRSRMKAQINSLKRLKEAGVEVVYASREEAVTVVSELLGI